MSAKRTGFNFYSDIEGIGDQNDETKILSFNLTNISSSTTRIIIIPDRNINISDYKTDLFRISDNSDNTKKLNFDISGISTSTTRILTIQDKSFSLGDFIDDVFRISDNNDNSKKVNFDIANVSTSNTRIATMPDRDITLSTINVDSDIDGNGLSTNLLSLESPHSGTSFPSSPYDGYFFYRTDLQRWFTFDNTRSKWLGRLESLGGGGSGSLFQFFSDFYLNLYDGMTMSATQGILIPYDITIVGISYNRTNTTANTNIIIRRNGTDIYTIGLGSTTSGSDLTIDSDFDANGILSIFVDGTGFFTFIANPQIKLWFRRRTI